MLEPEFVSFRDSQGYETLASYHPIQIKIIADKIARRWMIYLPVPTYDNGVVVRIDWSPYTHPFRTRYEALAAAETMLSDALADDTKKRQGMLPSPQITRDAALQILGLPNNATVPQIKSKYNKLIKNLHPDVNGSHVLAAQINQAKDVLIK